MTRSRATWFGWTALLVAVAIVVVALVAPVSAQTCLSIAIFEATVVRNGGTVAGRINYPGTATTGVIITLDPGASISLWVVTDNCVTGGVPWDRVDPGRQAVPEDEGTPA